MCSIINLDKTSFEIASMIEHYWPPMIFRLPYEVIYTSHIPNVAVYLKEGNLFIKDSNATFVQNQSSLVGLIELIKQKEIFSTITLGEESLVSLIDRASLTEKCLEDSNFKHLLMKNSKADNYQIFE